jgi:ribosomal-protein-alanine N-acetyltransferase
MCSPANSPVGAGDDVRAMAVTLHRVSRDELSVLAEGGAPRPPARAIADGALPPAGIAKRALQQLDAGKSELWCGIFYMVREEDGVVVGSCGFKNAPVGGQVEIGYGVAPMCRNQGAATEAVRELCRLAFAASEVQSVLAEVSPANPSSSRVVEKLDFARGATKADEDGELVVQWVSKRKRDLAFDAPADNDGTSRPVLRADGDR